MADTRTPEQRSRIMRAVGQRDTGPELQLRRWLHTRGYRYRLHDRRLPGKPDLSFPSRRAVVFVHGCFWHGHDCPKGKLPGSRQDYWSPKIGANRDRDARQVAALQRSGWKTTTVWQCELKEGDAALERVADFLDRAKKDIALRADLKR